VRTAARGTCVRRRGPQPPRRRYARRDSTRRRARAAA
jgi:hypothetical protein